ncbi:hypothetical protein RB195_018392 [Necator americanus]|uniref:protein-tyrosine-phosphatase n=1 Tax=Necator americanus TaxID=51031 RepID=A0ABR1CB21_NECAM
MTASIVVYYKFLSPYVSGRAVSNLVCKGGRGRKLAKCEELRKVKLIGMDSFATKEGSVAMLPPNRVSTRSTRKSKSKVPTPKKLIESFTARIASRKLGDGVLEAHKEFVKESPTFFAYWKKENMPKNLKQDVVLLYDWSRVVLNESPDYYHASYVDGCSKPQLLQMSPRTNSQSSRPQITNIQLLKMKTNSCQYIMAQAPFNDDTQADYFRMLSQTSPDAVIFMDAHNSEDAKYILPTDGTYGGVSVKVEDMNQCDGYTVRLLAIGKSKVKVYCINGWSVEKEPPKDLVRIHEKV